MAQLDAEQQRAKSREMWERAAPGWGRRAARLRDWGMPVSVAMIEALALQPGQRVLELAAGPGDTGFIAAELIQPGGTLVSSDGAEAMVELARTRAREAGIDDGIEFRVLELEWIDLPTASVDAALCRWGIMLTVDPEAAAREVRRVLRAGGRAAFAVWDRPELNPWATIASRAMVERGHVEPPDPDAPGMFALAAPGRLQELLEDAGFVDVRVEPVEVQRTYDRVEQYIEDTIDVSPTFGATFHALPESEKAAVIEDMRAGVERFSAADGSIVLPGRSLVAVASG